MPNFKATLVRVENSLYGVDITGIEFTFVSANQSTAEEFAEKFSDNLPSAYGVFDIDEVYETT